MFMNILSKILASVMAPEIKRLFLVVSLTFEIVDIDDPEVRESVLRYLNDNMDLALRPDALKLPALVHGVVWSGVSHPNIAISESIANLNIAALKETVQRAPSCIRYSDVSTMTRDVVAAITNVLEYRNRVAA